MLTDDEVTALTDKWRADWRKDEAKRERKVAREAKRALAERERIEAERTPIAHRDEVGRLVLWLGVIVFWAVMAASCGVNLGQGGSLS